MASLAKVRGKKSLYFKDLDTGDTVSIHADRVLKAASLIKIPIVVALYDELHRDPRPGRHVGARAVNLVLGKSHNTLTNPMVDRIGMAAVNTTLDTLSMPVTRLNRRLTTNPMPENWTTAAETGRLLELISAGRFPPPDGFPSLVDAMRFGGPSNKLGGDLPEGAWIARKGGRLPHVVHDAAIIKVGSRTAVIVVMVQGFWGRSRAYRALARIGRAVAEHLEESP